MKKVLLTTFLVVLSLTAALAQVTTSSLNGTVTDGTNAVPGATVLATHIPTGTRYGTISNAEGKFNIVNMRVGGPYTVEISFVGYQTTKYENLTLKLGEPLSLNVKMSESATELNEVIVSADGLGSGTTGASTGVSNEQINSLPTLNRSITEFTRLTPQSNGNSFAGRDARYNNLQVDGANFNNGFGLSSNPLPGGGSQPISLDAIQEITINIAPFDVTQSGFTGAGINAVTRSGSNTLEGSAYYFMKNQNLQGRNIEDVELEKVDAGSRNYGLRVGGPIIKNKLFFFVNAEREVQTGANASGANLWKPSENGVADPENNIARTTRTDLEDVRNHLINEWGYNPGRYEGYASEGEQYNTKFLARIDWNISQKHKLSLRYNQVVGVSAQVANGNSGPRPRSSFNRVSQNSMTFENGNYGFENSVKALTAELSSYFSPKISNQFLATYSRIQDTRTTPSDQLFPFVDIWDGGRGDGDANYMSFGTELFSYNNDVINDNFSFINNLTYITGKHNFTFGAAFEVQKFGNSYMRMGTSYYRYASVEDFLTTGTGGEVAPIMFGLTYPYEGQDSYSRVSFGLASLYAQDKYAVSDKLNVTVGLRAELPIYLNDLTPNNAINAIELQDTEGNAKHYNSGSWPKSRLMLSPRVGFNYDVNGDRTLVVRGGTGVFSGRVPFVWLTNMPTNSGVIQNTVEPGSYGDVAGWIGNVTFQPQDPNYYVANPPAGAEDVFIPTPEGGAPGSFALVDDDFRMPMVWRSSLAAEYTLGNSPFVLSGELIYTHDVNAVYQFGANRETSPNRMNAAGDERELVLDPADITYNPVMGANNATILANTDVKGYSFSATLGVSVPNWQGLSGSIYYTYATAKEVTANAGSNAGSAWGGSPNINNPNDQRLNISDYAIPHRFVANVTYRIEYAKHFATSIGLYYTGGHQGRFSYVYSNDLNGDGTNADLLYIPSNSADMNFVDNGAFTAAQQRAAFDAFVSENGLDEYRGDYAPRNGFLLPWLNRFDVRVLQDLFTNIGSRRNTLQLSLDIVNVGNLLNKNWGIQSNLNGSENLLSRSGAVAANPNFTFAQTSGTLATQPFVNASNYSTTWAMQLGLRYIF